MTAPLPGPWVDPETIDPSPWTNNHGIVKFIEFPVRIPKMSHRAFHLYWQRHHSPNVMNATGFSQFMRKYTSSHVYPSTVPGLPTHYQQTTPFEGAAEVWINSLEEAGEWLGHPLYAELIQPDEPHFIAQDGSVEVIIAKEERVYAAQQEMNENGLVKLFLLMKRQNRLKHDEFHAGLSEHARSLIREPSLRALLRKVVVSHRLREPWPAGMAFAEIDATLELWFSSREDIASFFTAGAYNSGIVDSEASLVDRQGVRAVATKVHVVHDEFSFQSSTMQPFAFSWAD